MAEKSVRAGQAVIVEIQPANRPRDPAYAFVSIRPAEKVFNEISVLIGYQLKPGSEDSLEVGSARYAMYSQGDGLWIKIAAEEAQMVEALKRGADVTVKGVSVKGTETVDVFSLKASPRRSTASGRIAAVTIFRLSSPGLTRDPASQGTTSLIEMAGKARP